MRNGCVQTGILSVRAALGEVMSGGEWRIRSKRTRGSCAIPRGIWGFDGRSPRPNGRADRVPDRARPDGSRPEARHGSDAIGCEALPEHPGGAPTCGSIPRR
jgi:hypothetical protein